LSAEWIAERLRAAVALHQAGRLAEAERIYREILAREPAQPDALHLLGVIAQQVGKTDLAIELIRRAIAIRPTDAIYYNNLAHALSDKGSLDESIIASRQATQLEPTMAEAHNNLGNVLQQKGLSDQAIAPLREALRLKPNFAEAHNNLGNALQSRGDLDLAIISFRTAIRINPSFARAHNNLGNALAEQGMFTEAVDAFGQALRLQPGFAEAHYNLGNALRDWKDMDGAIECYRRAIESYRQAIEQKPGLADAHCNLAAALRNKGMLDEALAASNEAIRLNPQLAMAHANMGVVLYAKGLMDESMKACRRAVTIDPQCAAGHFNLALALLVNGDLARGWEEYEWRLKWKAFSSLRREFVQPKWSGEALDGKRILIYAEQGLGDVLHFARYAPKVAERGGRVILECKEPLLRLFASIDGVEKVVCLGEELPEFDVVCSVHSLPLVFKTTLETIPAEVPYLHPDAQRVHSWAERLSAHKLSGREGLKVGIVWAGSPRHVNDQNRSIRLASFAPLGRAPGVTFFSLQKGDAASQAAGAQAEMSVADWTGELTDFAETAALMANLDLVITVDTSVAHLAGAMAKRVWVLIPSVPDWRWMLQREDSPWYPTMRLFRQNRAGEWDEVIERLANALAELERSRR
jgi:tetratricopeptide (TPR) repeat protein